MTLSRTKPAVLALDESRYIIDPFFNFCPELPTYREWLSLDRMTSEQIKGALKDEDWRFEHLVDDPDNCRFRRSKVGWINRLSWKIYRRGRQWSIPNTPLAFTSMIIWDGKLLTI